tara:strand:+ start:145 stop:591 length:447 start_codon:yes stop_codon:yes gene_type:complete
MLLLLGGTAVGVLVVGGLLLNSASKDIGNQSSFEERVENFHDKMEHQNLNVHLAPITEGDDRELIRQTTGATYVEEVQRSVLVQSNGTTLNGDEGDGGEGHERPIKDVSSVESDGHAAADVTDTVSGEVVEDNDRPADAVNPDGQSTS